jgi:hypothetical protein
MCWFLYDDVESNDLDNEHIDSEELINNLLEQWKVGQYATNRYLHNIPQARINKKRDELKNKLKK